MITINDEGIEVIIILDIIDNNKMDEEDRNGSKTSRRRQGKGKRRRSAVWADDDDDVSRRMTSKVDEMLSTKMTSSPLKLKFVVQSTKKSRQEELPSKKFNSDDNSFRLSTDSSPLSTEFTSPSKLRMKISMTNKTVAMSHDITNDTVDESFDGNSVESSVDNSSKKKSSRVAEFIADRSSRVKSYFRRRHAPFKRTFDLVKIMSYFKFWGQSITDVICVSSLNLVLFKNT